MLNGIWDYFPFSLGLSLVALTPGPGMCVCVFGSMVKTQSFAGSASLGELQLIQVLMNLNILERPCRDFLFLIRLLGPFFSLKTTKKARIED